MKNFVRRKVRYENSRMCVPPVRNSNKEENTFAARYRKRTIYVSSEHGFGKAKEPGKTRFYQEVYGDDGIYDMECYNDFYNIEEAIIDTLEGAGLAKNN